MHALVLGLVGAALAVGAARADGCKLGSPLVVSTRAQWKSDIKRADLIGKTFQVKNVASRWDSRTQQGSVAVAIEGGGESFLLVNAIKMPADSGASYAAAAPEWNKVSWGKRDPRIENNDAAGSGFIPDTGPLAKLILTPKC